MAGSNNLTPHNSSEYDDKVRKTIPYYESFHTETIDVVKTIKPDVHCWLDTGCGTGFLIEKAYKIFPWCMFIVSDPAKTMLVECKKRLRSCRNVIFLKATDTAHICLKRDIRPGVITAIQAHHYMDNKARRVATQNCYNLLKNHGVYITFENIKPETSAGINIGLDRWMGFQREQGRDGGVVAGHRKRFNTKYFPVTINEHIRLLYDCGFAVVELFWYSYMQAGFYAIKNV